MSHRLKLGQARPPTNIGTNFGPNQIIGAMKPEPEIPGVGHGHDVRAMGVNPGLGQGGAQDKFAEKIKAMSANDFAKLMQRLGAGPIV